MSLPRVIVTTLAADQRARVRAWRQHAARVTGLDAPEAVETDDAASVWHLASSNNRMLARRVAVFRFVADAAADARRCLAEADRLEATMVRDRRQLTLGWVLRIADRPVLVSARWYSTERDRRRSADAALEAMRTAVVEPAVRIASPSVVLRRTRG